MSPSAFMDKIQVLLDNCDFKLKAHDFVVRLLVYGFGIAFGFSLMFTNYSVEISVIIGLLVFITFQFMAYGVLAITSNSRINTIEETLPDFLTLMGGNIRSGLTPDRALLLSARKEFGLLSREIDRAAKEMLTGASFADAFMGMTARIRSETFSKTVRLIVEGVRSGGNLAELLENTALDIRRFGAIRKEISATVLSYQLFMFAAACLGAPLLYAVSNFLIETVSSIKLKTMGKVTEASSYLPLFSGGSTVVPVDTVFWFSVCAIAISAIFGSLAAGVISKGKESEGFPYIPIMLFISFAVFFVSRFFLETMLKGVITV